MSGVFQKMLVVSVIDNPLNITLVIPDDKIEAVYISLFVHIAKITNFDGSEYGIALNFVINENSVMRHYTELEKWVVLDSNRYPYPVKVML